MLIITTTRTSIIIFISILSNSYLQAAATSRSVGYVISTGSPEASLAKLVTAHRVATTHTLPTIMEDLRRSCIGEQYADDVAKTLQIVPLAADNFFGKAIPAILTDITQFCINHGIARLEIGQARISDLNRAERSTAYMWAHMHIQTLAEKPDTSLKPIFFMCAVYDALDPKPDRASFNEIVHSDNQRYRELCVQSLKNGDHASRTSMGLTDTYDPEIVAMHTTFELPISPETCKDTMIMILNNSFKQSGVPAKSSSSLDLL